eukprot:m.75948 g.75948  ORF g.75948 m.75948 type:complete len:116 (-) comp50424_c0_seq3:145-492(-)
MSMFAALTQSMRAGVRTLLPPVTNVAMCAPAQGFFSLFPLQVREYRVRTAIKRRCDSCQVLSLSSVLRSFLPVSVPFYSFVYCRFACSSHPAWPSTLAPYSIRVSDGIPAACLNS